MWSAIWNDFFRPCWALTDLFAVNPAMNRWAIFARPHRTFRMKRPPHFVFLLPADDCLNSTSLMARPITQVQQQFNPGSIVAATSNPRPCGKGKAP